MLTENASGLLPPCEVNNRRDKLRKKIGRQTLFHLSQRGRKQSRLPSAVRRAEQSSTLFWFLFFFSARSWRGRDSADSSRDQSFCSFFVSRVSRSRACTRRYWQNPSTSEIISFIGASVCSAGAMSMPRHVPCYTVTWCTDYIQNYKLPALIQSVSLLKFHGDVKYDESIENETFIIKNKKKCIIE